MDNQNAKKNGLVGIAGDIFSNEPKLTNEEDVKKATDSTGGNNQDVVIHPQNYENVQTKSVVETAREQAEKELAQIKAYNEEMLRRQKAEEAKAKAKRATIRTVLIIFFIVFVIVVGWVVISALMNVYNPPAPEPEPEPEKPAQRDSVNGYKCTTDKCYKMADMPDGRVILRDDQYFVFDPTTRQTSLTTIQNQEYYNITAFTWGNDILVDLDPETDFNGLFSINENRMITGFNYDSFIHDIKDSSYNEMNWAEGQYIVARKDSQYRLIRLVDGKEIINGTNRVFVHDSFCISYGNNGERRVYTLEGDQFLVAQVGSFLYVKGNYLVYIKTPEKIQSYDLYGADGKKISSSKDAEYARLHKNKLKDFIRVMDSDKAYYKISAE